MRIESQIVEAIKNSDDPSGLAKRLDTAIMRGLEAVSDDGILFCGPGINTDPPPGGYILIVDWCTNNGADEIWFSTEARAMAALQKLALENSSKVEGWYVDLTRDGCHRSSANIKENRASSGSSMSA